MTFEFGRGLIAHMGAFAIGLQTLEFWQMQKLEDVAVVWSSENVREDLGCLPLGEKLASTRAPAFLSGAGFILACALFLHPTLLTVLLLLFVHVTTCVRFRGSVNGGSDAMTVVVLTGLAMAYGFTSVNVARFGLWYIAIFLLLSYLRAGFSKLMQGEWRSGQALHGFLAQSFNADIRRLGLWLKSRPTVERVVSWLTIVFEISLVFSVVAPAGLGAIFAMVVCFHFAIYVAFGLNRFFWIWLSAWPSIFYVASYLA